jgi:hypothetical protein
MSPEANRAPRPAERERQIRMIEDRIAELATEIRALRIPEWTDAEERAWKKHKTFEIQNREFEIRILEWVLREVFASVPPVTQIHLSI